MPACVGCFPLYSQACFFFCAVASEPLFYILCIELQVCKNTVTGELVPLILATLCLKNVYISNTSVTCRSIIIPILSAQSAIFQHGIVSLFQDEN